MSTSLGFTISPTSDHTCEWRARAERAERTVADLSAKLNELQAWEERRRKYDSIPNQALSAKAVRMATHLDAEKQKWSAEGKAGPQMINVERLGAEIGFGEAAARSALDELARVGHTRIIKGEPIDIPTKNGRTIPIEPILIEPLNRDPDELDLSVGRNHGGWRCAKCPRGTGTTTREEPDEVQMIKRTIKRTNVYCAGCGQHLATTSHAHDEVVSSRTVKTGNGVSKPNLTGSQIEIGTLPTPTEPADPPTGPQLGNVNQLGGDTTKEPESPAEFLASIAGTEDRHIEMQPAGATRYQTVASAITPALAAEHLAGRRCLGGSLKHADGTARALCFDGDDAAQAAILKQSAVALAVAGAHPVLVGSPSVTHPGGGHLWIVFDQCVNAAAALATIYHHAPELREIGEYWPRPSWAAVRLPGAYYKRPEAEGWCDLWAPGGVHRTGQDAVEFLMSRQTPAAWVTESPEEPPEPPRPERSRREDVSDALVAVSGPHSLPIAGQDPAWLAKYSRNLPYWITDDQAAAYFNARHHVEDLLPPDSTGYGRAHWRGEEHASVMLYPETNTWADFGNAEGRNGKRDGGDALALYCRITGTACRDALAAVVNEMRAEADRILGTAGRAGHVPAWVVAITSPAGWARAEAQWNRPPYQVSA